MDSSSVAIFAALVAVFGGMTTIFTVLLAIQVKKKKREEAEKAAQVAGIGRGQQGG